MTLILQGTDNSVSSPAVQGGTAGTTTGVYYPASNQIALATNGTLGLIQDASQNVGIAKSAPVARLHLAGSGTSGQVTSSFIIENTSSGTMGIDITGSAGSSVARFRYGGGPGTGTNSMTGTFMTVGLEGGSAGTQGIYFAPTQVASANANTLDDYEEGTWTPIDSSGASLSFSVTQASYCKIGSLVYIQFYLTYPSTSNGTNNQIGGLPFTAGTGYAFLYGRWQGTAYQARSYQVNAGATTMICRGNGGSTDLTNADLSGNYILVSGCYSVI